VSSTGRDIVLFGPPGVGKGAQASVLSDRYGLVHCSTGDVIRDEIARRTSLGERVAEAVAKGDFADDETVLQIIMQRIDRPEFRPGFVMDGFPRTVTQAERFDLLLNERGRRIDHALFISASEEVVLQRLGGRLICQECGKTYHKQFRRPRLKNVCDECSGPLVSRHDDNPEVHRERLHAYVQKTALLASYYRDAAVLREIDGSASIEDVADLIGGVLNGVS